MNRKTKIAAAALAISALALTGCAPAGTERTTVDGGWLTAVVVVTPDGRDVTCVVGSSGKGIDCDWESAR